MCVTCLWKGHLILVSWFPFGPHCRLVLSGMISKTVNHAICNGAQYFFVGIPPHVLQTKISSLTSPSISRSIFEFMFFFNRDFMPKVNTDSATEFRRGLNVKQ